MSRRRLALVALAAFGLLVAYLTLWPVPIDPVPWQAPPNPGYTGAHAENRRLAGVELIDLAGRHGPEDLAQDAAGRVYAATEDGAILRLVDGRLERFAETGGRPLGIEFDRQGTLWVADAFRGLLAVSPQGAVRVVADVAEGVPIRYADDVDIADDGVVYFTDASTKFGAEAHGGTYPASVLDINEHGGYGRLLVHDPRDGSTRVALDGLQFANGVAVSHDQRSVLVVETGEYRVIRWPRGGAKDAIEPVLGPLPGFPDNLARGRDGRYWVGLISPRSGPLDAASGSPFVRRIFERLPAAIKPKARAYPHVVAFDEAGRVVADLQDPAGAHAFTTGVLETDEHLYVSSLRAPTLARLPRAALGL